MIAHANDQFDTIAAARAHLSPEAQFVFDVEGPLYELEALSTSLELLLLDVINEMRPHERGRAAAIDFAASTLRQRIYDLAARYDQIGQPEAPAFADYQRDDRGRFVRRAA